MTLQGLKWRLKLALWALYTDTFWDNWKAPYVKDKSFLKQRFEKREAKILQMTPYDRQLQRELFEEDAMYLIRKMTQFAQGDELTITRAFIFKQISNKQEIEQVEKKLEDEKKAKERAAKMRKPIA